MKTLIKRTNTTPTGFCLTIVNDDQSVQEYPIDKIVDEGRTLALPENPSGRKYWAISKMDGKDELELSPKGAPAQAHGQTEAKSAKITFTDEDLDVMVPETAEIIREAYAFIKRQRDAQKLREKLADLKAQLNQLTGAAE